MYAFPADTRLITRNPEQLLPRNRPHTYPDKTTCTQYDTDHTTPNAESTNDTPQYRRYYQLKVESCTRTCGLESQSSGLDYST